MNEWKQKERKKKREKEKTRDRFGNKKKRKIKLFLEGKEMCSGWQCGDNNDNDNVITIRGIIIFGHQWMVIKCTHTTIF